MLWQENRHKNCTSPALPRQLQVPEHWHHHLDELWEARPPRSLPRHDGPRDGPQLWLAGE